MVTVRLQPANKKLKKFNEIESQKLKLKEKLAYGFGDLGNGLMFDMGQIYLLLFYTDILGIPSAVGGLVFLVAKFFDAFVDTGVGTLVDIQKNFSKRGKFRPFILYGSFPLAIFTDLTIISHDISKTGIIIFAFGTYLLINDNYSYVTILY